jgi:hypothetical protein
MYLQKVVSRQSFFFISFFVGVLKVNNEIAGSISQRHGSADPGPYQNVVQLLLFQTSSCRGAGVQPA